MSAKRQAKRQAQRIAQTVRSIVGPGAEDTARRVHGMVNSLPLHKRTWQAVKVLFGVW